MRSSIPIFMSLKCPDDGNEYTKEACKGSETASMGYYASITSKRGNYFVETNAASPFSN